MRGSLAVRLLVGRITFGTSSIYAWNVEAYFAVRGSLWWSNWKSKIKNKREKNERTILK